MIVGYRLSLSVEWNCQNLRILENLKIVVSYQLQHHHHLDQFPIQFSMDHNPFHSYCQLHRERIVTKFRSDFGIKLCYSATIQFQTVDCCTGSVDNLIFNIFLARKDGCLSCLLPSMIC